MRDTGEAVERKLAHLLGLALDRLKVDSTLAGGVLENNVLMELRKQSAWAGGSRVCKVLVRSFEGSLPWITHPKSTERQDENP